MLNVSLAFGSLAVIIGCVGVRAGFVGLSRRRAARKIREDARNRYENAVTLVEKPFRSTLDLAEKYDQLQNRVKNQTIARFLAFIERIDHQISPEDRSALESLEGFSLWRFQQSRTAIVDPDDLATRKLKALWATHPIDRVAFGMVGLFGAGALDRHTLLAWLSGNASSGDSGLDLEILAIGGILLAPAITLGGFLFQKHGEKSLLEARRYEATIEGEMSRLATLEELCEGVSRRLSESLEFVRALNRAAIDSLNGLEARAYASGATLVRSTDMFIGTVDFVVDRDKEKLQEVLRFVRALAEITAMPILDDEGKLEPASGTLQEQYGDILAIDTPRNG